jgi:hypothetical protein
MSALANGSAEAAELARQLGATRERILRELEVMACLDLVDAIDPPPPCSWDCMRWHLRKVPVQ